MMTALTPLFAAIEAAVDAHPRLRRSEHNNEASMTVSRDGWTARISVKGSNKKPHEISNTGATPEEAANKLIAGLDIWAQVL